MVAIFAPIMAAGGVQMTPKIKRRRPAAEAAPDGYGAYTFSHQRVVTTGVSMPALVAENAMLDNTIECPSTGSNPLPRCPFNHRP